MARQSGPIKAKYTPGQSGAWAVCRYQCDGDWAAATLLYRLKWRWGQQNKLQRFGLEWIAESSQQWADGAGLTFYEFRDRALPRLRKQPFVKVRQMRLSGSNQKLVWMSLLLEHLPGTFDGGFEHHTSKMHGMTTIGCEKAPKDE